MRLVDIDRVPVADELQEFANPCVVQLPRWAIEEIVRTCSAFPNIEVNGCIDCPIAKAFERLSAYEDTGLAPEEIKAKLDGLDDYQKLDAQGRLVVLPCKVGDRVYQTDGIRIYESTVRQLIFDTENIAFDVYAIGKTVFLTKEEAEEAMRKGENLEVVE